MSSGSRRIRLVAVPTCLLLVALAVPARASKSTGPQTSFACSGSWEVVASPNLGSSELLDVDATSDTDAWAVGYHVNQVGVKQGFILHWDGQAWVMTLHPNVGTGDNILYAVEAISGSDAWAVGSYVSAPGDQARTLILHWDGSTWSVSRKKNVGALVDVSAVSSSDAWAVGAHLLMHWDGTAWSSVRGNGYPSSYYPRQKANYAVAAVSSSDVWVAGTRMAGSIVFFKAKEGVTFHWDGASWTEGDDSKVSWRDISAASATDIWRVGTNKTGQLGRIAGSGVIYKLTYPLNAVSTVSTTYAWAVGYRTTTPQTTLTMLWDGASWSSVSSPNVGSNNNSLNGIWASSTEAWAVGSYVDDSALNQTLVEHFC